MRTLKRTAIQTMTRYPLYRVMPPSALRAYATLRYHTQNSVRQDRDRMVAQIKRIPPRNKRIAFAAIRAAFRAGQDALVMDALAAMQRRFPDLPETYELRADLHSFRGEYADALREAERACAVAPTRQSAVARLVKYSYRSKPEEEADAVAIRAVSRFAFSSTVMWAVAKECTSTAQFHRIREAWNDGAMVSRGKHAVMVRQLATAATRAREIAAATEIYRRGLLTLVDRRSLTPRADGKFVGRGVRSLAGRGAWPAIEDLVSVLDDAGVPYFFAAGTALGFVREGGPLSADTDVDVGILDKDWDRTALIDLLTADPRFEVETHPLSDKVHITHRGETPIDIFRFYPEDGWLWHDGVFVRWRNSEFDVIRQPVRGLSVPLPADADTYLTENYGDWRTPNPSFDPFTEDAPNVEVVWPEYQRMHLVRRAYKQAVVRDLAGAQLSLLAAGDAEAAALIGARAGLPAVPDREI